MSCRSFFAACFCLASGLATAAGLQAERREFHLIGPNHSNAFGMAAADFDADGHDELVVLSFDGLVLSIVREAPGGELHSAQTLAPLRLSTGFSSIAVQRQAGGDRLMLATGSELIEFAGWPLRETRRLPATNAHGRPHMADIDADGTLEIVRSVQGLVEVSDYAGGASEWMLPRGGDVAVLQLDADAAREIVVGDGYIYDGATRAQEHGPFGYGVHLAGLRDAGGDIGFAASSNPYLRVFGVHPYASLGTLAAEPNAPIAPIDIDGDGRDELALRKPATTDLRVVNVPGGAMRFDVALGGIRAVALAAVDFDGDGRQSLASLSDSGPAHLLRVDDPPPAAPRFALERGYGNHAPLARGDVDADGNDEWVVGAQSMGTLPVRIYDVASGALEFLGVPETSTPDAMLDLGTLRLLQLDADPQLEIVLGGRDNASARLIAIDGITHTVQLDWRGLDNSHPAYGRRVADIVALPGTGAVQDLLLALQPAARAGHKLVELRADGGIAWESVGTGAAGDLARGLFALQTDADEALEYVLALDSGLRAYDAQTRLPEWTLPEPLTAVTLLHEGVPDRFVVAGAGVARVYDAATRMQVGGFSVSEDLALLQSLPGSARWLLGVAGDRLELYDVAQARRVVRTGIIGYRVGHSVGEASRHLVVRAAGAGWDVAVGDNVGFQRWTLADFGVFGSGFE